MADKEKKTKESLEKFQIDPELAILEEVQDVGENTETILKFLKDLFSSLEDLKKKYKKGDQGDQGPPGKPGPVGIGIPGKKGEDGKNGSPDTPEQIRTKLESLFKKDGLDLKFIKGLEKILKREIVQAQGQNKGGIWQGSANPFAVIVGALVAQNVRSITFMGATMVNRNGDVTISISGSAGTAVLNEVVGGSSSTFTLAHTPVAGTQQIYANGQRLIPTVDYSISGAIITTVLTWSSGSILADYEY